MKSISPAYLVLALSVTLPLRAQEPPTEPTEPAAGPPAVPRVVGQAQTQAELDSWHAIEDASDLKQKEDLAERFLATYPESGLTPYIHYSLANAYRKANQTEAFVQAAEKALQELQLPEVSSDLAFLYAETGRGELAVERANQTLDSLKAMRLPRNATPADWARACHRARGNANYALGRVELDHSMSLDGDAARQALTRSADFLERSIQEEPENPYPAFRLGQSYTNLGRLEEAIQNYARATAVGGVIGPYARQKLEEVYRFVHEDLEGLDKAVQQQRRRIADEVAARAKELQQLEKAAGSADGPLDPARPPSS